jgi:hypothetical protein
MPGKRLQFDDYVLDALVLLGQDRMATLQDLADEAFADLLRKHHRPLVLKAQLKESLSQDGKAGGGRKPRARKVRSGAGASGR